MLVVFRALNAVPACLIRFLTLLSILDRADFACVTSAHTLVSGDPKLLVLHERVVGAVGSARGRRWIVLAEIACDLLDELDL